MKLIPVECWTIELIIRQTGEISVKYRLFIRAKYYLRIDDKTFSIQRKGMQKKKSVPSMRVSLLSRK